MAHFVYNKQFYKIIKTQRRVTHPIVNSENKIVVLAITRERRR